MSWKTRSRAAQALELVLAQVLERGAGRELVDDERGGGRRQQHLTAVPGGHDARRAVQGRAEVVALPLGRLAGVQPHPDAERAGLAPRLVREVLLGGQAGADAVDGRVEDGHEAVADRLHDLAARALDGAAQDGVVALERSLHGLLVVLPERVLPSMSVNRKVSVRDAGSGRVGCSSVAMR